MNMRRTGLVGLTAAIVGIVGFAQAWAEDQPAAKEVTKPATKTASPEDIGQWIKDLDSNSFTARQTASRKLAEAGKDAIDPLGKAATGDSLEVTRQAIDILRHHFQSGEAPLKDAAQAALKKLSESDNKSAASRASEILTQAATQNTPNNAQAGPFGPAGVGRIIIGGGGAIQINGNGGFQKIQVQNNNGVKTIDVDDNGKKIKIEEDNNGIKVTTTEKVNGQDKTETTEAKDVDELKKKNPEAAKAYEKYGKGNGIGNIQIQIQAQAVPGGPGIPIQIPGGAIPAIPLNPAIPAQLVPIQIGNGAASNQDELKKANESVEKALKSLDQALEQLKKNPADAAKSIEEAKQALDEAHAKLEAADAQKAVRPGTNAARRATREANDAVKKAAEEATDRAQKALDDIKKAAEDLQKIDAGIGK